MNHHRRLPRPAWKAHSVQPKVTPDRLPDGCWMISSRSESLISPPVKIAAFGRCQEISIDFIIIFIFPSRLAFQSRAQNAQDGPLIRSADTFSKELDRYNTSGISFSRQAPSFTLRQRHTSGPHNHQPRYVSGFSVFP